MALTSGLPTQPGWYWVANDTHPSPTIIRVVQQGWGTSSTIQAGLAVAYWTLDGTEVWEGPLQPS
jgi:hypothetical protein